MRIWNLESCLPVRFFFIIIIVSPFIRLRLHSLAVSIFSYPSPKREIKPLQSSIVTLQHKQI